MQNESDALDILAFASGQAGHRYDTGSPITERNVGTDANMMSQESVAGIKTQKGVPDLAEFALVNLEIVDEEQVSSLTEKFFRYHHHLFVRQYLPSKLTNSPWYLPPSYREHLISSRYLRRTSDICWRR